MARPGGYSKHLELHARYVLAAPLVENKRILDLGGASAASLVPLAEAGAAELSVVCDDAHAYQDELTEIGLEGVTVTPETGLPLPYDDGAFDFILCHDLAERVAADAAWESELRRVLGPDGYLMAAVANPNGHFLSEIAGERFASSVSYEDLVGQMGAHFAAVTVFGQSPLAGTLFYDFADSEEQGLSLDRALLPDDDEAPGWYVILFGPEEKHRDDLAIVQLPFDTVTGAAAAAAPAAETRGASAGLRQFEGADEDLESAEAQVSDALAQAHRVIASLEAELAAMRQRVDAAEVEAAQRRAEPVTGTDGKSASEAKAYVAKLERQLETSQGVVAHLEATLAETRQALAQRPAEAGPHAAVEAARAELQATHAAELGAIEAELRSEIARLEAQLLQSTDERGRLGGLEQELGRAKHDKTSYESQIKDLLEEVGVMRGREEELQSELTHLRNANG
ncbi:MAG TPA: methyltransferase domain-containing protein, partial [Myxococcota bacterium]|nr:methyltransferase domain-containing protein [Myxococcota bacterium]